MYITLSIKEMAIGLVLLAVVALIIYICLFFKNLIITLKKTNDILENTKAISSIAEKRTKNIDQLIDNVVDSVSEEAKDEGIVKQLSNIAGAVNNIFRILGKKPKNNEDKQ